MLAVILSLPPAAFAAASSDVLQAYEQTGTVPACKFSGAELSAALKRVDTYGAQYLGNDIAAINHALLARAGGQCSPNSGPAAGAGSVSPSSSRPLPVGSVTAATGAGLPLPIVLLGLLAAIAALAATFRVAWGRRSRDPEWAASGRHALNEIGYRAGGIWSEFVDWLRSA